MPNRGMWIMNDTKRCCGYRGVWGCADDYPDHMVPVEMFSIHRNTHDGLKGKCFLCSALANAHTNPKYNTNSNAISKEAYKIAGSSSIFYKKPRDERLAIRKDAKRIHLLNTTPAEEVLAHIEKRTFPKLRDKKPKFNEGLPAAKPARKRTNLEPLDKLPPEGWVYIIAASRHASIMKIGSTFEYGIRDRLSEAKRWALAGSAVLLHKEWFSRCKQAESLVHKRLDYYRIVSPDAGDELFRTSFEHALANVMIIKNEVENDRKEQAVG